MLKIHKYLFVLAILSIFPGLTFGSDLDASAFKFTGGGWQNIVKEYSGPIGWDKIISETNPKNPNKVENIRESFSNVYFDYREAYEQCLKSGRMLTVLKGMSVEEAEAESIVAKHRGDLVYIVTEDDGRFPQGINRYTVRQQSESSQIRQYQYQIPTYNGGFRGFSSGSC